MTKKRNQTMTSVISTQSRSLRPRKRTCYDEDDLGKSAPSGEAREAQPLYLQKEVIEGTLLKTASLIDPQPPPLDCATGPLQQIMSAVDTTAPKQGAVQDDYIKDEKGALKMRFFSPAVDPPTVTHPHANPSHIQPAKEVKVLHWDGQTTSAEDRCGEKSLVPPTEERDTKPPEGTGERGDWSVDGGNVPQVEDKSREVQTKVTKRRRMGMCGLGERKGGVEEEQLTERKSAKDVGMVHMKAEEKEEGGGGADLVVVEGTTATTSLCPSDLTRVHAEQNKKKEDEEGEEKKNQEKEEEPLRSGDEARRLNPGCVPVSGYDLVAEALEVTEVLEGGPSRGQQPLVQGNEEVGIVVVVEDNQEGDRGGFATTDLPSFSTGPPPRPLEDKQPEEVLNQPNQSVTESEVGGHPPVQRDDSPQAEAPHTVSSAQPPPTKPDRGADLENTEGPEDTTLTPGGREECIKSPTPDLYREDDDAALRWLGVEVQDYVSDSQLNTIAMIEEEEDKQELHEDATELICGLIRELSSLNRVVMSMDRELETFRHGNRTARLLTRRPRRTEI
ncbi:hypothetical protein DPEC_G00170260 [Dallia pectoralis]|uniref:Uncharacterized protein n=1 Tax=Dallia pectoralis TaxID=75939 RepID=A0ACC2GCT1_DALPE|nr:hypothetical protein DPEC_G00170260 [Dallia pectoralis]